jgi:hypothetical protein
MFKPTIQLSLAKNKKPSKDASPEPTKTVTDYAEIAMDVASKAVFGATCVLAAYIVLDTARQVVVNKTNPSNYS